MFSSTATRLAPAQSASASGAAGRRMAQSVPRVSGKPVSSFKTATSATNTGTSPQRSMISRSQNAM